MRRIVAGFAISLDGFIEGPNGEYDWIIMEKDFDFAEHMKRFDTFFIGRKTYEKLILSKEHFFPSIKHYVFSHSLTQVNKNYDLVNGHTEDFVQQLKQTDGKDIALFGGADLLTSFLNAGLVDELILSVVPVILGKGKAMLGELNKRIPLQLTSSKVFSHGVVMLYYEIKNT